MSMEMFSINTITNTHCAGLCNFYLDVSLMGKGVAYSGLFFRLTGCPVPGVGINYLIKWLMYGVRFRHLSSSIGGKFIVHGRFSWMTTYLWTPLYQIYIKIKLMKISMSVPGFATAFLCNIWVMNEPLGSCIVIQYGYGFQITAGV